MSRPIVHRDVLDTLGLVAGAILGTAPGLLAVVGHAVVAATGTGAGDGAAAWGLLLGLGGAGAIAGLAVADRLAAHRWPGARAIAGAALGLVAGSACGFAVLAVLQNTPLEPMALVSMLAVPPACSIGVFRRLRDR